MKKVGILFAAILFMGFSSCNKCAECHYDGPNGEVDLEDEYCGDELEAIEASGYVIPGDTTGTVYTVHCGEDH